MSDTPLLTKIQKRGALLTTTVGGVPTEIVATEAQLQALVAELIALAVAPLIDGYNGSAFMQSSDIESNPHIIIGYDSNLQGGKAMDALIGMYERAQQEQKGGGE